MKILVTGGAGFIGSGIADAYIRKGHEVVIIDNLSTGRAINLNPGARFIEMDINDRSIGGLFDKEKFDIVCHQAAQVDIRVSVDDPLFDARTNVLGSLNLYEASKNSGVKKIIFASSGGAVYGEQESFPAGEGHPTNPCSPYGISKLVNEKYLFYYREVCGMDFVALRYGNVYGPRQNPHGEAGVVAIFIRKMLGGEQPVIHGDGKKSRDYVYVGDVVRANLLALDDKMSGAYNVGTAIENDVNFIFAELRKLTGSICEEVHGPAKSGEQRRSVISFDKLKNNFGWQPETDFASGLEKTVEFFKRTSS